MDYDAKYTGKRFVEVGKNRPRTVEVVSDHIYEVGTVVLEGRGKNKPLRIFRKQLIDPKRWRLVES